MANKKAQKALALVLSATTIASVSVPAITSSVMVSAASSSVINMDELQSKLTIKREINGTDLGANAILKFANVTITVNTDTVATNKFTYSFKVYEPASDGSADTNNLVKPAVQKDNYFTFKPDAVGNYTLSVKVVNKSTGESITKSFNLEVIESTTVVDGSTVYDTNGNRYTVLDASKKNLTLTGITESKSSSKAGFEFNGGTVSIVDNTIENLPVNMEGFTITQFGDGTNPVVGIKHDKEGNAVEGSFNEINIPSTVEVIRANSLTTSLVKCVYKSDKTTVKTDALVILGSKNKNDLYSSKLNKIEANGIADDMIANTVFRTYHANLAGSACPVGDDKVIKTSNGYKMKFSWLNNMPVGAKLEAPFGSWAWTAMQIISRFDCSKEEGTTYTHVNGYGSAEKKNFKIRSTDNGSLSKPIHDSVYDRDMIIAVNFYNNKQATATSTPKYRLVVNNGGIPSVLPNGTTFVIDNEIFNDLILKRKVDKTNDEWVYTIYPNTQADTGLNKNDKIKCVINATYNVGKGAEDNKIEMVDFEKLGCIAYSRGGKNAPTYGEDGKLPADAEKLFDAAVKYPVFKLSTGVGYIAFKAGNVDYGKAYKKDSKGGEDTVKITMSSDGTLTSYNNAPYTMDYHIQTKDELKGIWTDNGIGEVSYTRGKWNTTTKSFDADGESVDKPGDKLKINFKARADRYYLVEYVDMTSDNDEVKVLWNGAAKGKKGFDGGSDKGLLLDSKTTDNKFYEIRVTEFTNTYKGDGYGKTARFTAYPLIDGRGFLKVYQSNKTLAAGVNEELDFNTKGTRYIKYYGVPGESYQISRYTKNEKTGVITSNNSTEDMTNGNNESLCRDTFGVYNGAINVKKHEFSTAEAGANISDYCIVEKVIDNKASAVPVPRVWLSSCAAKTVTGKNSSGGNTSIADAIKVCTYSAKGVRLDITGGSNGYYMSNWGSNATKKACRAIAPKVNSDGSVTDNKMKVTVNVSNYKTMGKTVDRQTIKVVYSTNFRKYGYSLSSSSVTWKELANSAGAFTNKDSVEFVPVNGLVFYRIAYKYVGENTVRYTNIKAVNYNALTGFSTSQQIKTEPTSNIGSASVLDKNAYKQYNSNDYSVIIKASLGDNAITTVPTSNGKAKITINNAYSSVPAKSTLTPILKTSKNLKIFDGIVSDKKFATVQFKTSVFALKTGNVDNPTEIKGTIAVTETTDNKDVQRTGDSDNTANNISYTASKSTDMKGSSDITFSTVKADGTVDRNIKYVAVVQECTITNPDDVGVDTSFSSDSQMKQKTQSRVYVFKLQERSYEPVKEHNNKIALRKDDALNKDEIKVKVTGCYTKDNNAIFSAYYKKSGSNKKLFNVELDEPDKLDGTDFSRLSRTLAVFNPQKVVLKFNYTKKNGKSATASFTVNRITCAQNAALKTSYADTDKTNDNNSSVFIVTGGKVTGIEYVITAKRILDYLNSNNADMTKFSNGTINATLFVYSGGISGGTVASGTEVETTMPALANSAYRSHVTIDVSEWA